MAEKESIASAPVRRVPEFHADDKALALAVGVAVFGAGVYGLGEGWPRWWNWTLVGVGLVIMAPTSHFVRSHVRWVPGRALLWAVAVTTLGLLGANIALRILSPPSIATAQQDAKSQYEGTPIAFLPAPQISFVPISAEPQTASISFSGKNLGADDVVIKSAVMVSQSDGTRLPLQILAFPDGYINIEDADPVQPNTPIILYARIQLTEAEFMKKWGAFAFIVETAGGEHFRRDFDRSNIGAWFDHFHPERQRHVTKRKP